MCGIKESGDLVYDKLKKIWVQRRKEEVRVDKLRVSMKICIDSYKQLMKKQTAKPIKATASVEVVAIADTGCSTL